MHQAITTQSLIESSYKGEGVGNCWPYNFTLLDFVVIASCTTTFRDYATHP